MEAKIPKVLKVDPSLQTAIYIRNDLRSYNLEVWLWMDLFSVNFYWPKI